MHSISRYMRDSHIISQNWHFSLIDCDDNVNYRILMKPVRMKLDSLPRVSLAHLPTPIEPMKRLSAALGGPDIWIKRDDCTGLATGGNKARKLEFLMGAALQSGVKVVATHGAIQSNHARQTAAAAGRLGLACHILLEDRTGYADEAYSSNGNVLLDQLHGAVVHRCPARDDMNAALATLVKELPYDTGEVYEIPGGGSNATGAAGYALAASEILEQIQSLGFKPDAIVHGTGSAGTQAGLATGLQIARSSIPVHGISVRANEATQKENVLSLTRLTAELLDHAAAIDAKDIHVDDRFVGPGYGIPAASTIEAIETVARLEGILLDPVYSGKGMAGLIGRIREGVYRKGQKIIFLHTGGSAALFAYPGWFHHTVAQAA